MKCRKPQKKGKGAHIFGWTKGSARHSPKLGRECFTNPKYFLFLCSECHEEIDEDPKTWTSDKCFELRAKHLKWVEENSVFTKQKRDEAKEKAKDKLIKLIREEWPGVDFERFEICQLEQEALHYIETAPKRQFPTRIFVFAINPSPVGAGHREVNPNTHEIIGYNWFYVVFINPFGIWKVFPNQFWNFVANSEPLDHFIRSRKDYYVPILKENPSKFEIRIITLSYYYLQSIRPFFDADQIWPDEVY